MAIIRDFQDTDLRDVFGQVSRLARSQTQNGNRPLCLREPHFP